MNALSIDEANAKLDSGQVWCLIFGGREWQARRNGRTQVWKTRPGEFRIPVKAGFRTYYEFTHNNYRLTSDGKVLL
jgi:hypothetical protein